MLPSSSTGAAYLSLHRGFPQSSPASVLCRASRSLPALSTPLFVHTVLQGFLEAPGGKVPEGDWMISDVRDVASALILAALKPGASGRYIVSQQASLNAHDVTNILKVRDSERGQGGRERERERGREGGEGRGQRPPHCLPAGLTSYTSRGRMLGGRGHGTCGPGWHCRGCLGVQSLWGIH